MTPGECSMTPGECSRRPGKCLGVPSFAQTVGMHDRCAACGQRTGDGAQSANLVSGETRHRGQAVLGRRRHDHAGYVAHSAEHGAERFAARTVPASRSRVRVWSADRKCLRAGRSRPGRHPWRRRLSSRRASRWTRPRFPVRRPESGIRSRRAARSVRPAAGSPRRQRAWSGLEAASDIARVISPLRCRSGPIRSASREAASWAPVRSSRNHAASSLSSSRRLTACTRRCGAGRRNRSR